MSESEQSKVWGDGWRVRFVDRLRALGCDSATEYLARHPAMPYIEAAKKMGGHIAALQLEWAQFDEASNRDDFRSVAIQIALAGISVATLTKYALETLKRCKG